MKEGASSTASRTLLAIIEDGSACSFSVVIARFIGIVVCQSGASFSTIVSFATTHNARHMPTDDIRCLAAWCIRSLAKALACICRKQLHVPDTPQSEMCVGGEGRGGRWALVWREALW